jgi:ureidoglycolate lyase
MTMISVIALTSEGFAPFGEVIDTRMKAPLEINQGFAQRFDDLARIDVDEEGGKVKVSLFSVRARRRPIEIKLMERHPLGSQLFFPLQDENWLVLVCDDPQDVTSYRAFQATGQQGINYRKGVWHHPLVVFHDANRFIVVDRKGPGNNLEEVWLERTLFLMQ